MITNGIIAGDLNTFLNILLSYSGPNSISNINPAAKTTVYPKASPSDAPYDVAEAKLRSAIYIPQAFTFGKKPPVILFPGTGSTGYTAYAGNFIKLLANVDYADPVWVNVPGYLLDDAQVNAVSCVELLVEAS
jgi:hypothetical protein